MTAADDTSRNLVRLCPPRRRIGVPAAWRRHGVVVLAGAGISIGAPANVPSWWGFNQAVLDGLRRRLLDAGLVPARARTAIEHLNLDDLEVTEFSQVVHNAFAGVTWFELVGVLDGETANATHMALAALAGTGLMRAIVTTNFDTLLERALAGGFAALNPLLDVPPRRGRRALIKLHGSADRPRSLVDLAAQKRRGLPPEWRAWLRVLFSRYCVLVLGFSGADLDMGDDYLGLRAAAAYTPWLGWNVRSGCAPHARAAEVLVACGDRGHLIEGDLPGILDTLGLPVPSTTARARSSQDRLARAVDAWLDQDGCDEAVCGIAMARLLDAAGRVSAADALRSRLRTTTRRALRVGLALDAAARASLVLGQLGIDDQRPTRALKDVDLAERALRQAARAFTQPNDHRPERGEIEYARNMSALAHSAAVVRIRAGDADGAERVIARAHTYIQMLPPAEQPDRLAAHWQNTGALAWLRGDPVTARTCFETARLAAIRVGDLAFIQSTEQTLARLARAAEEGRAATASPSTLTCGSAPDTGEDGRART